MKQRAAVAGCRIGTIAPYALQFFADIERLRFIVEHATFRLRPHCEAPHLHTSRRAGTAVDPVLASPPILGNEQSVHFAVHPPHAEAVGRSEEHTSELQSLMRISYAVFCLKKKTHKTQ